MQEKNGIFFNFFKIKIFAKTIDKSLIFGYNVFRCLQNKKYISKKHAEVAELADAHGSGPCGRNTLWVRLPSSAPEGANLNTGRRALHFFKKVVAVVVKFSK